MKLSPFSPPGFERKLTFIVLVTVALGMALAGGAFLIYDHSALDSREVQKLGILAEIVRAEGAPALEFQDRTAAAEILAKLSADPQIAGAAMYTATGELFSQYTRGLQPGLKTVAVPPPDAGDGGRQLGGNWVLTMSIVGDQKRIGSLVVVSDLHEMQNHFRQSFAILGLILLLVSAIVAVVAARLLGRVTRPILDLSKTVQEVGRAKDYSLRVPRRGADELGLLVDGFNGMLGQIQARDQELLQAHHDLERRVEERTRELKEKEEQLLHSQKMEAVGRLAGGIAHDFNNLLTAINGFSELGMMQVSASDPVHESLTEIRKAGERATALTQQLLAFSRKQVLQPKILDLNLVILDMEGMLKRLIGENIRFEKVTSMEPVMVKADPGQIQQVVMNLAINARDSMGDHGTLTLETAVEYLDSDWAPKREELKKGRYAMVTVRDTGCGMSEEILSHLFEPFYTTKAKGKGTGLGTSMVYGIIKQSGGSVKVESAPGKGTAFIIAMPLVGESGTITQSIPIASFAPSGSETILLVEDEDMVRSLASTVLKAKGYTVLEATNGVEAMKIVESHSGPIDLLFSDVIMPNMGGRELAEKAQAQRKGMYILLTSGFTDDEMVHKAVRSRQYLFLPKPYTPQGLLERVRFALDRKAATAPPWVAPAVPS